MVGIARYFIRKAHRKYKNRKARKLAEKKRKQADYRKQFGATHGVPEGVKQTTTIDKSALPQRGSRTRHRLFNRKLVKVPK